jgi:hypothetical protein
LPSSRLIWKQSGSPFPSRFWTQLPATAALWLSSVMAVEIRLNFSQSARPLLAFMGQSPRFAFEGQRFGIRATVDKNVMDVRRPKAFVEGCRRCLRHQGGPLDVQA